MEKARGTIGKYAMLSRGDRVLVGLSGGPDSVCLLRVLGEIAPEYGISLLAVYVDHGLRPSETPGEIAFCGELCSVLGVAFFAEKIEVKPFAKSEGLSTQEAARELRYRVFDELAAREGAGKIALGHTMDDQAETVLMRLFRGAGPSGLSGIPPVRKHLVRPLIEVERDEIMDFFARRPLPLARHPLQSFVIDSSNLSDHYLRNRIRHRVMPAAKGVERSAVRAIARTADIFRDEERYFDILVTKSLMRMISRKSDAIIELFLAPMEAMEVVILRRVLRRAIDETRGLREIGFIHIEGIIGLIKSGKAGDRIYIPKGIRAIRGYSTLIITSEMPARLGIYQINAPGDSITLNEASMVIRCGIVENAEELEEGDYGDGKRIAMVDADKVRFPLLIRPRTSGDSFYPLGLGKRKKLQDFFVDEKAPRDLRDSTPLIISDGEIVWVAGYRIDERFRIEKSTVRILKFEIKSPRI
ncbi:MAG TPA: tRNA lysidine(34) synthetase TilS [Dissulfurispiraceae bacterium]